MYINQPLANLNPSQKWCWVQMSMSSLLPVFFCDYTKQQFGELGKITSINKKIWRRKSTGERALFLTIKKPHTSKCHTVQHQYETVLAWYYLYLRWLRSSFPLDCWWVSPWWYGVLKEHLIHEIRGKGEWVAQRHLSSYDIPSLRLSLTSLSPPDC